LSQKNISSAEIRTTISKFNKRSLPELKVRNKNNFISELDKQSFNQTPSEAQELKMRNILVESKKLEDKARRRLELARLNKKLD
jgi:hypothetical protein